MCVSSYIIAWLELGLSYYTVHFTCTDFSFSTAVTVYADYNYVIKQHI